MAKKTALYDEHKKLGARIIEFAGWEMPVQYSGVTDEHLAVRNAAGLFDVSHMGTFEIKGNDAGAFLDYLTPLNASTLEDGQAHYSLLLKEEGTIIDDIIVYRKNKNHFYMVVNASNLEKDFRWTKEHLKGEVTLTDLSEKITLLALQGPKAAAILSKLTDYELSSIKVFYTAFIGIKGAGEIMVARTGYTGEDGFELFVPREKAVAIWRALIETGLSDGIKPVGLGARDTLRLEMKYCLYGNDIDETTNPLEAGLRWVIKFKKPAEFIGKKALLKIEEEGLKKKLVGFKMLDKAVPRHNYIIKADGKQVGRVTSGSFSPSLEIPIGCGYVQSGLDQPGTKFYIDIRGKERLAEVVKTFFNKKH